VRQAPWHVSRTRKSSSRITAATARAERAGVKPVPPYLFVIAKDSRDISGGVSGGDHADVRADESRSAHTCDALHGRRSHLHETEQDLRWALRLQRRIILTRRSKADTSSPDRRFAQWSTTCIPASNGPHASEWPDGKSSAARSASPTKLSQERTFQEVAQDSRQRRLAFARQLRRSGWRMAVVIFRAHKIPATIGANA